MNQPTISVIISAYTLDRWDDLVLAVMSVRRQSFAPKEIIVVVDHNPDLMLRVQRRLPNVIAVENVEPRGLSGARNSGIRVAQGEVIAFLDDDAEAVENWLELLRDGYADQHVLGVGGAIEPNWVGRRPAWFPAEFDWVVGCTYRGMPDTPEAVRNLIGCNMSFRREVFNTVGGFRTGIGRVGTLPVGCDETELCIRVLQRWPESIMLYEPRSRVRHRVPESRARWSYFSSRCYAEGISKALVARFVGARDGLASERDYTMRTLPRGVATGVADVAVRRDLAGLARSGAIVMGLSMTVAGYLAGRNPFGRHRRSGTGAWQLTMFAHSPMTVVGTDAEKGHAAQ